MRDQAPDQNPDVVFYGEVSLLDWGESRTTGPWIKLKLQDPTQLDVFRGMDVAEFKKTQHIFNLILTEEGPLVAPEETEPKGGALSKSAAMFCLDLRFQEFCNETYGTILNETGAVIAVRTKCKVDSRRQLDHDELAKMRFLEMRKEFLAWRESHE